MALSNRAIDPNLGRVIRDRYRLESPIGSGAMGAVYRAWDIDGERVCAVKLLHAESASRPEVAARFCDEARMISRLCHPNIVELWDAGQEPDQTLFLVMEHLQGQDLYSYLNVHQKMPIERALDLIQQIGSALHTVHLSGIVHRDIKPGNVFVLSSPEPGTRGRVKVIDFGLSKIFDGSGTNRGSDGLIIGTPEYLPPEAWRSDSSGVDARSDQWALGVLSYRVLSGRMPFGANQDIRLMCELIHSAMPQPLREQVPGLPAHIDAAVLRTMAKEKQQRFDSVLDFTRALRQLPLSLDLPKARGPARTPSRPVALPGVRPLPAAAPARASAPVPEAVKPPRDRTRWALPAMGLVAGAVLTCGLFVSGGVLRRQGWAAGLSRAFSMPVPQRAAAPPLDVPPLDVPRADVPSADEAGPRPAERARVPARPVSPSDSPPDSPSLAPSDAPTPTSKRRRRKRPAAEVRPATAGALLLSEAASDIPRGLLPR